MTQGIQTKNQWPCDDYDKADGDDDDNEGSDDGADDDGDGHAGDDGDDGHDDGSDDEEADAWCQCVSGPGESLSIQNWPYPPHYIHQIHLSSKYTNTH